MITIVDYNAGNIKSIANMLAKIGVPMNVTSDCGAIENAEKLILPGVGHFDFGMRNLDKFGLVEPMRRAVLERNIPFLGICLGAQLITKSSEEGRLPGLGWVNATTVRFDRSRIGDRLRIPHMGWADTKSDKSNVLFDGFVETPRFYYVHSYHILCDDATEELCYAFHGYRFTSGVCRGNIFGVQFHPEKSHRYGLALLHSFCNI